MNTRKLCLHMSIALQRSHLKHLPEAHAPRHLFLGDVFNPDQKIPNLDSQNNLIIESLINNFSPKTYKPYHIRPDRDRCFYVGQGERAIDDSIKTALAESHHQNLSALLFMDLFEFEKAFNQSRSVWDLFIAHLVKSPHLGLVAIGALHRPLNPLIGHFIRFSHTAHVHQFSSIPKGVH